MDTNPLGQSERLSRTDWWGVVLDTPDVGLLTKFYSELRGWSISKESETWATLDPGNGVTYLAFQLNPDFVAPVWPTQGEAQQMMSHLDFEVTDLDSAVARAIALGASIAEYQPQENVRVLLDPVGHPFCLYVS